MRGNPIAFYMRSILVGWRFCYTAVRRQATSDGTTSPYR